MSDLELKGIYGAVISTSSGLFYSCLLSGVREAVSICFPCLGESNLFQRVWPQGPSLPHTAVWGAFFGLYSYGFVKNAPGLNGKRMVNVLLASAALASVTTKFLLEDGVSISQGLEFTKPFFYLIGSMYVAKIALYRFRNLS